MLIIALWITLQSTTLAQDGFIHWSPDLELTWADYKGPSQGEQTNMHAMTASGINSSINIGELPGQIEIELNITAIFSQNQSWTDGQNKQDLLHHEQIHFDITEWVTRQFIQEVQNFDFSKNFFAEYNELYEKYSKMHGERQDEYDRDTRHSNIDEQQAIWNKKVSDALKELEQYSDGSFTLVIVLNKPN